VLVLMDEGKKHTITVSSTGSGAGLGPRPRSTCGDPAFPHRCITYQERATATLPRETRLPSPRAVSGRPGTVEQPPLTASPVPRTGLGTACAKRTCRLGQWRPSAPVDGLRAAVDAPGPAAPAGPVA